MPKGSIAFPIFCMVYYIKTWMGQFFVEKYLGCIYRDVSALGRTRYWLWPLYFVQLLRGLSCSQCNLGRFFHYISIELDFER